MEPLATKLAVSAIAAHNGQLLMVQRGSDPGKGQWSVPGGRVEFGESVERAVVREVEEETGLHVSCGRLLGWTESITQIHHFVILGFVAHLASEPHVAVAGSDADNVRWVPTESVAELDLVQGLVEFLRHHNVIPARREPLG